jgi:peptidoglycan/LPS O-acetylase OafA/YrhL
MAVFSSSSRPNRYLALDGLRGVAALSVMFHHLTLCCGLTIFNNASLAVDLFFVLSGFVITHSYSSKLQASMGVSEYVRRRLIRLYPMFIAGILIGIPVLFHLDNAGLADYSKRDLFVSTIYNSAFLPYLGDKGIQSLGYPSAVFGELFPTNPPAWSLFFELIASLVFVALIKMTRKTTKRVIVASYAALIFGAFLFSYAEYRHDLDLGGWGTSNFLLGFPRVLFGFTFGVFLYRFANDGNWVGVRNACRNYIGSPWILYAALLAVLAVPTPLYGLYPALILAVVIPSLVFIGGSIDCNNVFDSGTSKFLGWISYPIYCLHFPIGRYVFLLAGVHHFSLAKTVFLSVAMTVGAAVVLAAFYEEPMRAYLTRRLLITMRNRLDPEELDATVENEPSLFPADFRATKPSSSY